MELGTICSGISCNAWNCLGKVQDTYTYTGARLASAQIVGFEHFTLLFETKLARSEEWQECQDIERALIRGKPCLLQKRGQQGRQRHSQV